MTKRLTRREFAIAAAVGLVGCSSNRGVRTPSPSGGVTVTGSGSGSEEGLTNASRGGSSSEPTGGSIGGKNFVFVTADELERQKQRVERGEQPWKQAYDDLLNDVGEAVEMSLQSVADNGGGHDFVARRDNRHDYRAAMNMSKAARDCGLAYWFTDEDRYAESVVRIVHHWTLNEDTYMEPTLDEKNKPFTIEQHITIPAFMYGASFVRGHPAWEEYEPSRPWDNVASWSTEAAFNEWLHKRYLTFPSVRPAIERGWCEYNNKWAWRITDRAATAAYLRNDDYMWKAKEMWRAETETTCDNDEGELLRPWHDFENCDDQHAYGESAAPENNGYFVHELGREQAFNYTAYNLKAMTSALVVFERYDGADLWEFNAPQDEYDGSSMWKAYNWFEEFVRDTAVWRWNKDGETVGPKNVEEATSTYELAYAHWGDFKDVLTSPDKLDGRPYHDRRVLGHVTLTHGVE